MSTSDQPTEEELRAAYESEIKKIRVEQIVLEQVVSLVNLGMRRTGLSPGTEDERDIDQVRTAIEAVRALLPLIEGAAPAQAGPIREALSQLQLAFVRLGGGSESGADPRGGSEPGGTSGGDGGEGAPGTGSGSGGGLGPDPGAGPPPEAPKPGEPGPAQRSGRLWVPGQ